MSRGTLPRVSFRTLAQRTLKGGDADAKRATGRVVAAATAVVPDVASGVVDLAAVAMPPQTVAAGAVVTAAEGAKVVRPVTAKTIRCSSSRASASRQQPLLRKTND